MLTRDSLSEKAVRLLVARIVRGQYPAGQRLPSERKLSRDLNVSRGTLRNCIATLKDMGLLESRHGSGTYVRDLDRAEVPGLGKGGEVYNVSLEDIVVAREAIETSALRLAQQCHSAVDLDALRESLESMKKSTHNIAHFMACDMEFHRQLVATSRNRVLMTAFDAIAEFHRFSQACTSYKEHEMESTIEQHERIVEAVESRDPERVDAVAVHLHAMRKYRDEEGVTGDRH